MSSPPSSSNSSGSPGGLAALLTSWSAVYTVLLLPAALMLANFALGSCVVGAALEDRQHISHYNRRARRLGRLALLAVSLSFVWQYAVFFTQSRNDVTAATTTTTTAGAAVMVLHPAASVEDCNALYLVWRAVDSLRWWPWPWPWSSLSSSSLVRAVACSREEWLHNLFLGVFSALYYYCVLSVPQVAESEAKAKAKAKAEVVSFCSRCGANIAGMDHHCYLINNCVSRRNRRAFLCCLACGVLNYAHLLRCRLRWALAQPRRSVHAGLALVVAFEVFLSVLLCLHMLLWWRGATTLEVLKSAREQRVGAARVLARLAFRGTLGCPAKASK